MNAIPPYPVIERPWLTYAKAVVFILPAVTAWAFACIYLVPKANEISHIVGLNPSDLGWIGPATLFLVHWGRTILVGFILTLVLLELVAPRWWRRRLAVGIGVWLANVTVLVALSMLLVLVLVAAPGLARNQ